MVHFIVFMGHYDQANPARPVLVYDSKLLVAKAFSVWEQRPHTFEGNSNSRVWALRHRLQAQPGSNLAFGIDPSFSRVWGIRVKGFRVLGSRPLGQC